MIELLSSPPEDDPKRHPLFSIDGEVFTIPAKPRAWVGMKFLWALRSGEAPALAEVNMMVDLLGEDAYTALMNCKSLTPEQKDTISKEAAAVAMGNYEADPMPEPDPGN